MNPAVDPQALVNLRELNPEDPAFLRELIDVFLTDIPVRLAELEKALAANDAVLLTRAAHTIKGSGGNFGTAGLCLLAQEMENQGKTADFAAASATLPALHAEFTRVNEALKEYR